MKRELTLPTLVYQYQLWMYQSSINISTDTILKCQLHSREKVCKQHLQNPVQAIWKVEDSPERKTYERLCYSLKRNKQNMWAICVRVQGKWHMHSHHHKNCTAAIVQINIEAIGFKDNQIKQKACNEFKCCTGNLCNGKCTTVSWCSCKVTGVYCTSICHKEIQQMHLALWLKEWNIRLLHWWWTLVCNNMISSKLLLVNTTFADKLLNHEFKVWSWVVSLYQFLGFGI